MQVIGDKLYENAETFTLSLSSPTGATIAVGTATGTINDNDSPPVLMIKSAAKPEGDQGSKVNSDQSWVANGNLTVADASGFAKTGAKEFYIAAPAPRSRP